MEWLALVVVLVVGIWVLFEQGRILEEQERDPRSPRYRGPV